MTEQEKKARIIEIRRELKELQATPRSDWHTAFEAFLRFKTHKFVVEKNPDVYDLIRSDENMSDVLMELVKDRVDKSKQEMTADHIKDIMDSFGVTIDKAMESLKIPQKEWDTYAGLVKKNM